MLTINRMTRYQAFRWLWRFDSEAKWFWFWAYLTTDSDLKEDIWQNFSDFGVRRGN